MISFPNLLPPLSYGRKQPSGITQLVTKRIHSLHDHSIAFQSGPVKPVGSKKCKPKSRPAGTFGLNPHQIA
jgi:hypothetical protein